MSASSRIFHGHHPSRMTVVAWVNKSKRRQALRLPAFDVAVTPAMLRQRARWSLQVHCFEQRRSVPGAEPFEGL